MALGEQRGRQEASAPAVRVDDIGVAHEALEQAELCAGPPRRDLDRLAEIVVLDDGGIGGDEDIVPRQSKVGREPRHMVRHGAVTRQHDLDDVHG